MSQTRNTNVQHSLRTMSAHRKYVSNYLNYLWKWNPDLLSCYYAQITNIFYVSNIYFVIILR